MISFKGMVRLKGMFLELSDSVVTIDIRVIDYFKPLLSDFQIRPDTLYISTIQI